MDARTGSVGRALLQAVLVASVCGCAQTVVQSEMQTASTNLPRPSRVIVRDFAVSAADVTENQSIIQRAVRNDDDPRGAEGRQLAVGLEAADVMADELVEGIRALGLVAERAQLAGMAYQNDVVIVGSFLNVDEGNRLRRLVVGFGAGGSSVDTQVTAYQVAGNTRRKLIEFTTHAQSDKMPGAAVTMGAGAAASGASAGMAAANVAVGGVKTYRSATGQMASRSAAQAVAKLSELFAQQGWIDPAQLKRANED